MLHVDELQSLCNTVQKTLLPNTNVVTFVKSPVIVVHVVLPNLHRVLLECTPGGKRKSVISQLLKYYFSKASIFAARL